MIITIPLRYERQITRTQINDILNHLNLNGNYSVVTRRGNGRRITIETDQRKIYVIFSARNAQDARNAFLNQYITTVLYEYTFDQTNLEKQIFIYLLDTSRYAATNYMIDTYKMLITMGIEILNVDDLNIGVIDGYETVNEWKDIREERRAYNSGNRSSYVLINEDSYFIFGKTFGANSKETALISCMVSNIARNENKTVHLFQVIDNETESLSRKDLRLLENLNIIIEDEITPQFGPEQYERPMRESSRNTPVFHLNLLNKYGQKKCFICGNDIEEIIIGAHIHRVADIDNSQISWEDKSRLAVDPDNGFWLCSNHDKLFEYGLFYFVNQTLRPSTEIYEMIEETKVQSERYLVPISDDIIRRQIRAIIKRNHDLWVMEDFEIPTMYYSTNMHDYLELHRQRVRGAI